MFGELSCPGLRAMTAQMISVLALAAMATTLPLVARAVEPQLATDDSSMYAVKADGTLWTWGVVPRQMAGASGVVAVALGSNHKLILLANGQVWASGINVLGQLGTGGTAPSSVPTQVSGLADVAAIAAGTETSYALKHDGTVWAWGNNDRGQLGIGNTPLAVSAPTPIPGLTNVGAIVACSDCGAALRSDGSVWTWGANYFGQLGDGTTGDRASPARIAVDQVVRLVSGGVSFFAQRGDGSVWAWGDNGAAQLANGSQFALLAPTPAPALNGFQRLALGGNALGLAADGSLWRWGGDVLSAANAVPTRVSIGTSSQIVELVARNGGGAVRTADGEVWMWGNSNSLGRSVWVGSSARYPVRIGSLSATQVAAGNNHSLALDAYGRVFAWGSNAAGQLGQTSLDSSAQPLEIAGVSATAIAACGDHNLALTRQGQIMAWGANAMGQLGHGGTAVAPVDGLSGIAAIACGAEHSLALDTLGQVWVWGANSRDQLGNGGGGPVTTPQLVAGLGSIKSIAAGHYFSLALTNDGRAYTWGTKGGDNCPFWADNQGRNPVPVLVIANADAIAAGFVDAFVRAADGTWYGWNGCQSGPPASLVSLSTPVLFNTLAAGGAWQRAGINGGQASHRVALDAAGSVWSWGSNSNGQLGYETGDESIIGGSSGASPTRLPDPVAIRQIAAGGGHVLAVNATGEVWGWGSGQYGQLGRIPANDNSVAKPVLRSAHLPIPFNVNGPGLEASMKEYRVAQDGSYFYSALPAEQQFIDSGGLGSGWSPTGNDFKVWLGSNGPAGSYPVCRFRGDNVTVPGFGHFYTALPIECDELRNGRVPYWLYEGTGFYVYMPTTACPAGTRPIYRQYNARLHNHHFQASNQLSAQQQADGWTMEGIPFCVGN